MLFDKAIIFLHQSNAIRRRRKRKPGMMTDGNRNDLESTQGNDRRYLDASQRKPDFLHSGERWRLGAQGRFGSVRSRTQAVSGLTPLAVSGSAPVYLGLLSEDE